MYSTSLRIFFCALFFLVACGSSQSAPSGSTVSNEAGTNILDSDGDGLVDEGIFVGDDTGGDLPPEGTEVCGDGEDNDGDTDIDCDDIECAMLPICD